MENIFKVLMAMDLVEESKKMSFIIIEYLKK